ncbi:class I SAM-dependent methyltransferase [Candidatus Dojkabacteria bacterium]|uniref:Class I SAM-dependent methyltransferase n=1 Tax=Candidatus Dojkabacteria bacterium TaxID=2099670 RepID=A0A5C7JAN8_9BACT|nr:MAG: class I SAM-dependent methyltransferase [Candidatus Dojkabacteria bacterium]
MNETEKREKARFRNFDSPFSPDKFSAFLKDPGIDIGFSGGSRGGANYKPAFGFTGVDLNYPGYDGLHLPFKTESLKTVHASHVLEHIYDWEVVIGEWFRVLEVGGHLIINVPHQCLYEKQFKLPSEWNKDHKRFYMPSVLLSEIEMSLDPNTYRLIYCRDNDWDFNYELGPDDHSEGCYEIECVIQKIKPPTWELKNE